MKKEIWKFPLETKGLQEIQMPIGAVPLTVQAQNEIPCLWAEVDIDADKEAVKVEMFGTGHPMIPENGFTRTYLNTFQLHNGELVFHAYIRK